MSFSGSVRVTFGHWDRLGVREILESPKSEFVFSDTVSQSFAVEIDGDILQENLLDEEKNTSTEQRLEGVY